ncbi:MAG: phosphate acetyltransferase [Acidobacteria bacterium]|nr:phosphate acetyltransferase [Acidobacteriota bacterium]
MPKNLYLTTTGPVAGKSAIALGLMSGLLREFRRVGYFRPIGRSDQRAEYPDPNAYLICSVFGLDCDPKSVVGIQSQQAMEMITKGRQAEMMEEILAAYKAFEKNWDFVLVEGTNYQGSSTAFEFEINAEVARNLGAPVLLVVSGRGHNASEIYENACMSKEEFEDQGCDLLGVIVNRVEREHLEETSKFLAKRLPERGVPFAGAIPEDVILAKPRMDEIAAALGADVIYGAKYLDNLVDNFRIASMQMPTLLERIGPGSLIIAAGDRADILLGAIASQMSNRMPKLAGVLLSSGLRPNETIDRLIKGMERIQLPVLAVETGTYETSINVSRVTASIMPRSYRKIETAQMLFDEHADLNVILKGVMAKREKRVTPNMFLFNLQEQARSDRKHIVLPEGAEDRILRAVQILLRRKIVNLTLLGREDQIQNRAEQLMVDLEGVEIIDPSNSPRLDDYAAEYMKLREHRGVTPDIARETMQEPSYYGTMMVYKQDADGMVSGSINTTAHTIRPAFEFIKTGEGVKIVSSVFFMCLADRVLVYGDCAVNPNPTAEELAHIAVTSANTANSFGIEPRVAMLSYATGKSGKGADVDMVKEATKIARKMRPDLPIEGPMQYDAAIDVSVARTKMPESSVAGRATVFIFPDLNTGNNTYKAVQRSSGAIAVGPVLQGLRKPVNDLSRGCTVPDIVNTVAITAIQAQTVVRK